MCSLRRSLPSLSLVAVCHTLAEIGMGRIPHATWFLRLASCDLHDPSRELTSLQRSNLGFGNGIQLVCFKPLAGIDLIATQSHGRQSHRDEQVSDPSRELTSLQRGRDLGHGDWYSRFRPLAGIDLIATRTGTPRV